MRLTCVVLVIAVFCLLMDPLHTFAASEQADVVDGSPSKLFASDDQRKHSAAAFVMLQREDLRRIFCPLEVMSRRETDSVAVLDDRAKSREVSIGASESVESFLQKCGKGDLWRNSWQPQARLITRNAIYQSPGTFDEEGKRSFLRIAIKAGDILVMTLRD